MELYARCDRERKRRQTLREHSRNVADFCGDACRDLGLFALGKLVGLLHDMGKAAAEFQKYLERGDPSERGRINHSACGARWLEKRYGMASDAAGVTVSLAVAAICGHHSGLPDSLAPDGRDVLQERLYPKREIAYEAAVEAFFAQCVDVEEVDRLYQQAVSEVSALMMRCNGLAQRLSAFCQQSDLPLVRENALKVGSQRMFCLGMAARFLHSALIDADRWDAFLFETGGRGSREEEPLSLWPVLSQRLEDYLAELPRDTALNRLRGDISDVCRDFAGRGPGVYRLDVPTGGGKTLSALRLALLEAGRGRRHIYYVAPYKTILEQNAGEIRRILQEEDAILEHHSDVIPEEEEGQKAGDREISRYQLLTERWTSPLILTTMVQFLNTLFSGRSACARRFRSLANAVLILDEVQAVPVKFISMLNGALNFLAHFCGCTVVLCTATQPELSRVPVPVLPGDPPAVVPSHLISDKVFQRTEILDLTTRPPFSAAELAELAADQRRKAGSCLVILNTRSDARRLFQALRDREGEAGNLCYLSTDLCPQHRMDKLELLKEALKREEPVICVSTQLIEAGVDISFGCVIRALAGIDSIAQAAGRCNRHAKGPLGQVILVRVEGENLDRLPEIRQAQAAANEVLEEKWKDPLSPAAVESYYQHYYYEHREELDYPVSNRETHLAKTVELYDLLSCNHAALQALRDDGKPFPGRLLIQAFETAGKLVKVIEDQGADVLVPYGEGQKWITDIAAASLEALPALLRKAQRFTVHLYEGSRRHLEEQGGIYPLGESGILALEPRFYDAEMGCISQPGKMEPMID